MSTRTPTVAVDNFDDDPFQHTTMTFGEHLEELRASLFKALLALAVGFGIGLCVANYVVQAIKAPLVSALTDYYKKQSLEQLRAQLREQAEQGDDVARRMLENPATEKLVNEDGMLCQRSYILPGELFEELKLRYPKELSNIQLPELKSNEVFTKRDLVPLYQWHPIVEDPRIQPNAMSSQEPFMIWMKAAFLAGAIISCPFVFYFLWSFVAAGLYPHEKRYVQVFLPFSVGLFLLGAASALLFVFPPVLRWFFSFNRDLDIPLELRISEWVSFVMLLPLGFGISFQLPLVMLFLERIGIFDVPAYLSKWRIAVLVIAVLSMVLSPGGDPNSMMLMFIPLVGLYFLGIGLCKWLPSKRSQFAD